MEFYEVGEAGGTGAKWERLGGKGATPRSSSLLASRSGREVGANGTLVGTLVGIGKPRTYIDYSGYDEAGPAANVADGFFNAAKSRH